MIGVILIVALILALVIQSQRAARLERELTASRELLRLVHSELIAAREVVTALRKRHSDDAPAGEVLEARSKVLGPPKGRSPGAGRVPSGRGRDRLEPRSPGPAK
jgi:hypothetical protein